MATSRAAIQARRRTRRLLRSRPSRRRRSRAAAAIWAASARASPWPPPTRRGPCAPMADERSHPREAAPQRLRPAAVPATLGEEGPQVDVLRSRGRPVRAGPGVVVGEEAEELAKVALIGLDRVGAGCAALRQGSSARPPSRRERPGRVDENVVCAQRGSPCCRRPSLSARALTRIAALVNASVFAANCCRSDRPGCCGRRARPPHGGRLRSTQRSGRRQIKEILMKRHATAIWKGALGDGTGAITTQSGALSDHGYSFKARFEDESGKSGTNPEDCWRRPMPAALQCSCRTSSPRTAPGRRS